MFVLVMTSHQFLQELYLKWPWDGSGGNLYKKMMNNFLAESINFFLRGGEVSKIESLPQNQFKSVTPGQPYGMRVKMWRSQTDARLASGSWGDFEVPQNVPVIVANGDKNPFYWRNK